MAKLGIPIVVVLFNGRPLVIKDIEDKVDAILEVWFPGTEGADAIVKDIVVLEDSIYNEVDISRDKNKNLDR